MTSAQQVALAVIFLPQQAWLSADAIGRTLWRLFVSRRKPARVAVGGAHRTPDLGFTRAARAGHVAGGGASRGSSARSPLWRAVTRRPRTAAGASGWCSSRWSSSWRRWMSAPLIAHAPQPARAEARWRPSTRPNAPPPSDTRARTGSSSTTSSPRRPRGWRPTTGRRIPSRSWRCAPRRRTSGCSSSRP